MKRSTLLALATFVVVAVVVHVGHAGDFYYSGGRRISLELSTEVVAITFDEGVTLSEMEIVVSGVPYLDTFDPQSTAGKGRINVLKMKEGCNLDQVKQTMEILRSRTEVLQVNQVYDSPDGRMFLTDEFVVQFKSSVSEAEIESLNEQHGVEIITKGTYTHLLRVKSGVPHEALEMANLYYESPMTDFAHPNFIAQVAPLGVDP